jgi:hypothetical protein
MALRVGANKTLCALPLERFSVFESTVCGDSVILNIYKSFADFKLKKVEKEDYLKKKLNL